MVQLARTAAAVRVDTTGVELELIAGRINSNTASEA